MDPYQELEIERKAGKPEIKRAYRKKAKKIHPDKGGSKENFQNLTKAYALLMNDEARNHYDETGSDNYQDKNSIRAQAQSRTADLATKIIRKKYQEALTNPFINFDGPISWNLLDEVRKQINTNERETNAKLEDFRRAKIYMNKVRKRLRKKTETGNPFLCLVLEEQEKGLEGLKAAAQTELEVLSEMEKILDGYDFTADKTNNIKLKMTTYSIGGLYSGGTS